MKFRVKNVTRCGEDRFTPQIKYLGLLWLDLYYFEIGTVRSYNNLEAALRRISSFRENQTKVKYIEVV